MLRKFSFLLMCLSIILLAILSATLNSCSKEIVKEPTTEQYPEGLEKTNLATNKIEEKKK